jgi:hypothetical protein
MLIYETFDLVWKKSEHDSESIWPVKWSLRNVRNFGYSVHLVSIDSWNNDYNSILIEEMRMILHEIMTFGWEMLQKTQSDLMIQFHELLLNRFQLKYLLRTNMIRL